MVALRLTEDWSGHPWWPVTIPAGTKFGGMVAAVVYADSPESCADVDLGNWPMTMTRDEGDAS